MKMDVEQIRQLAKEAEKEYSDAVRLRVEEKDDDEDSISSVLDEIGQDDILEQHLNSKHHDVVNETPITDFNSETNNVFYQEEIPEPLNQDKDDYTDKSAWQLPSRTNSSCSKTPNCSSSSDSSIIVEDKTDQLTNETNNHIADNDIKLKYIVEELISTEIEYLKSLYFLLENFLKPIRNALNRKLKSDIKLAEKMCNYTKMIYRLGTNFLDDLVQVPVEIIGNIFLKHKVLFNIYTKLSTNWNSYMKIVQEPLVDEFIKKLEIESKEAMGFSRYMLKPMQRLAKYELLLNQINKKLSHVSVTMTDSTNHQIETEHSTTDACTFIKDVLNRCNTIVALESIEYQKYNFEETGYFIIKHNLKWKAYNKRNNKKKVLPIEMFLFEKVVIIAIDINGSLQFRDSILLSNLTRQDHVDSLKITLEEIKPSTAKKPAHIIQLEAPNEQAKIKCLKSIDDLLWTQLNYLKQKQMTKYQ